MKVQDLIAALSALPDGCMIEGTRTGNSVRFREGGNDWWQPGKRYGYIMLNSGETRWYTNR